MGEWLGFTDYQLLESHAHFEQGRVVSVEVTKEGMIIKRLSRFKKKFRNPFSETDLVSKLSPYTAHVDELVIPLASEMGDEDFPRSQTS